MSGANYGYDVHLSADGTTVAYNAYSSASEQKVYELVGDQWGQKGHMVRSVDRYCPRALPVQMLQRTRDFYLANRGLRFLKKMDLSVFDRSVLKMIARKF